MLVGMSACCSHGEEYKGRSGCGMYCCVFAEYGEGVVSKYSCCQEQSGSPGCQLAKVTNHVCLLSFQLHFIWLLGLFHVLPFASLSSM